MLFRSEIYEGGGVRVLKNRCGLGKLGAKQSTVFVLLVAGLLAVPGAVLTGFFTDDYFLLWALEGGSSITGLGKENPFAYIDGIDDTDGEIVSEEE